MQYISTNTTDTAAHDLIYAVEHPLTVGGGLYLPQSITKLPAAFFNNITDFSAAEIGYIISNTLLSDDIGSADIKRIVTETLSFDLPLKRLDDSTAILELFHGPTLTFKDISARFMARLVQKLIIERGSNVTILVATTGNTGGAVASAFHRMRGARVVVLYPRGAMSRTQLAMFTTLGDNIVPVEISGNIEQCRKLAEDAVTDPTLPSAIASTPIYANAVNIARIIPQIMYFFYAFSRLAPERRTLHFAMPCGNLSNLCSAIMSRQMGLPAGNIIAGCNANDAFVQYVATGKFNTSTTPIHTLASAIDMAGCSNLPRIKALMPSVDELKRYVAACKITDDEIADTINDTLNKFNYLIDPHTAVALAAARRNTADGINVVLATSHPAKSLDVMARVTGRATELPLQLTRFMGRHTNIVKAPATYPALKKLLTQL